jgi:hypothetical protein
MGNSFFSGQIAFQADHARTQRMGNRGDNNARPHHDDIPSRTDYGVAACA